MKFGKRLKQQIRESLPEWRDKFLTYKDLKQQVNLISSTPMMSINGISESQKAEADFIHSLNIQINKFNSFFIEQEEDFIIRHPELQQRILRVILTLGPNGSRPSETIYREQMEMIKKDIINFHGKMVLLVNYSNINYIGLAKILKKYDKRTGAVLRSPFIQKVLQQPFFTTDLVSKLIKECESTIDAVFQTVDKDAEKEVRRAEIETTTMKGQSIFSNTVAALVTMQEIRRWSSTYSQFSLPPLNLPDSDLIQSFKFNSPIPTP